MLRSAAHPWSTARPLRAAFTLLEVILALAILAGSVAVLSEVMRLADRNRNDAEAETRAQLLASSLLDEMASGLVEFTEIHREPLDTEDAARWVYTVTISPIHTDSRFEGLTSVEILVEQDLKKAFRPTKYRLLCWLYLPPEQASDNTSDDSPDDMPSDSSSSSTEGG
jgi:prepilin-type N-terminal cleavage/methylation domain-containing protein